MQRSRNGCGLDYDFSDNSHRAGLYTMQTCDAQEVRTPYKID